MKKITVNYISFAVIFKNMSVIFKNNFEVRETKVFEDSGMFSKSYMNLF